jgi:hypothetical protein
MEIDLGKVNIKVGQLANLKDLKSDGVKWGTLYSDGRLVIEVDNDFDESKLPELKSKIRALPESDSVKEKKEQDYSKALDKIATAAGLSKDEKEALKEKERANVKKNS